MMMLGVKELVVMFIEYNMYFNMVVIWNLNLLRKLFVMGLIEVVRFIVMDGIYVVI